MTTTVLEMQAPGLLPFTPLMEPPLGMNLERWVPAIENIDDLQRLEQLLIAASEARNIESFAQMLHE